MALKVLILGINGFIGNHLTKHILEKKDWEVYGMDLASDKLSECINHPRLHFTEGDITIHQEWLHYHIKKCDVILPLVAIANPTLYVTQPLRVFALDFEANLAIVKLCVNYQKRLVFPSTSEVYGMSPDEEFDEENSNLVLGPIHKQRWIYSCSKQMLDRVIYAYGIERQLNYTLFRPFNWIGPHLDDIFNTKAGSSRSFSQFIGHIIRGENITLVDGGEQKRCFTYIDDAIDALLRIIENKDNAAYQQIFNIGNPYNEVSIKFLAESLKKEIEKYPAYRENAQRTQLLIQAADNYYGQGYQDVSRRVPKIENAKKQLGWQPTTDLKTAIEKTLAFYLT